MLMCTITTWFAGILATLASWTGIPFDAHAFTAGACQAPAAVQSQPLYAADEDADSDETPSTDTDAEESHTDTDDDIDVEATLKTFMDSLNGL